MQDPAVFEFRRTPVGRFCLRLLALSALGAVAINGWADQCHGSDPEALNWLQRMSSSATRVNYQGVVTLQRAGDGDMKVMRVYRGVQDGSTTEQLTQLTGQGAQVVRSGHPLSCEHPGYKLIQLDAAGRCDLARHYQFQVSSGERIAGRQAVRLQVQPRDMYRFGYVMQLDRDTGLLLQSETIGRGDKSLEKFQFASVSLHEESKPEREAGLVHETLHPHPAVTADSGSLGRPWRAGWLPGGFVVTDAAPDAAVRKTYTDGLAVFSVFVEELEREIRAGEGVVRKGGTTSYTRGLKLSDRPVLITVIGEVPVNTARMVADSVAWSP